MMTSISSKYTFILIFN